MRSWTASCSSGCWIVTDPSRLELALRQAATDLTSRGVRFALVGGLAVSVRAEVRFTRDVDLAVAISDDQGAEHLVHQLRSEGYVPVASVEHETQDRLSTVRLMSPLGVKVDLLFASSGIEGEAVERAAEVAVLNVGMLPVARAEELLAMKVLSMTATRLQDRMDAQNLLALANPDLDTVRGNLELISSRGYDRDQDLVAKLQTLLIC